MKQQSNNKKNREETAALYVRISRDDNLEGESNSVSNQIKLLTKSAKDKGYTNILVYSDDGVSGTTMERPGFQKMVADIERGYISAVFVKDMSRLGRNYIKVGQYTEEFFVEHDIRLVAVSDGIDSASGEDDFTPFRNIMNEYYAKDISKKRRIVNKLKGNSGEPLSLPPYGYIKDPDNPKRWAVDEESANVVRKIYSLALDGYGIHQIAVTLTQDGILNPTHYWRSKGIGRGGLKADKTPAFWNSSTIAKILSLQEYCGDVINFKTYSKSYKNKKRIVNDDENRAIFKGVHKPVVDRAIWEKVQQKRGTRKKAKRDGEVSIFSGLLKCADCGSNLNYHFNQKNHEIKYFNCKNNNSGRGNCTATHYIRVDFLEQVVLQEIRRLTHFAEQYEDEFAKVIIGHSMKTAEDGRIQKQKELDSLLFRDKELDVIFERLYEDNINAKINDERFSKMSQRYEQEQGELGKRIKSLRAELKQNTCQLMTADMFLEIVRRYTNVKELTQRMLVELIDHIDVYHAEITDGEKTQRINIHYNCIGAFDVPDFDSIPETCVRMRTRKGVDVSYSPQKLAM